jgi:hypothetical protein
VVHAGCASRRDRLLTVSPTAVDSLFPWSLVGNLVAAGSHDAVGGVTIIIGADFYAVGGVTNQIKARIFKPSTSRFCVKYPFKLKVLEGLPRPLGPRAL